MKLRLHDLPKGYRTLRVGERLRSTDLYWVTEDVWKPVHPNWCGLKIKTKEECNNYARKLRVTKKKLQLLERRTWDEFRNSGMLWFINTVLHVFGWALVAQSTEDGRTAAVYPARCRLRGFTADTNDRGYAAVNEYLAANALDLVKDIDNDLHTKN